MEEKTVYMFVTTSNYLKCLIEEIISSDVQLSSEAVSAVNELMYKLSNIVSRLHPSQSTSIQQSLTFNNNFTSSGAPRIAGIPFTNYGLPSNDTGNNTEQRTLNSSSHVKSRPVKGTENNKSSKESSESFKTGSSKKVLKSSVPSPSQSCKKKNVVKLPSPPEPIYIKPSPVSKKQLSSAYITKTFVTYMDNIFNGCLKQDSMCVYCRVCDLVVDDSFLGHTVKEKHANKVKDKGLVKLKMLHCTICGLSVFGTKPLILEYFKFHLEYVHEGETFSCAEAMEELELQPCSSVSMSSSLSSSISSVSKPGNAITGSSTKRNRSRRNKQKPLASGYNGNNLNSGQQLPSSKSVDNHVRATIKASTEAPIYRKFKNSLNKPLAQNENSK